jgi:signal-transduction protein with cAMP-binding, CBS, and nucleotidyltransferase domain
VLIQERAPGDDAYLVVDGAVRVVALAEGRTLALIGAPALVGEMAVVTEQGRTASVVADTPCTVLTLPGHTLRALMVEHPLFAHAMRERADLLLADAFLKRHSPLRDLPSEIVTVLAARLRPRELAPDQLIEGRSDDLYLVRRGAVERMRDGARTEAGDFVQREPGERYAAVGDTWIYELRMSDVAKEIITHQERLRAIAAALGDRARVRAARGCATVDAPDLGGTLVHDTEQHRAIVSTSVAALVPRLDGKLTVETLVALSGRSRGEIVEGLAVLIAARLATVKA